MGCAELFLNMEGEEWGERYMFQGAGLRFQGAGYKVL